MKKAIIIILSIFLVIIISAVFILPRLITLDRFRRRIESTLETSLNREVFLGDMGLTFWPGIGAEIKEVKIANLPGFSKQDFVRLKSFQVLIKILPLLTGNIQVDKFVLTEPRVLIEKNRVGKFNFADLLEEEKKEAKEKTEKVKGSGFIKGFMVSKASVDGGEVRYLDYSKPQREELYIKDIDLGLKDISLDKPINFDLSFRLKETPKKVTLEGTVGPLGKEINAMEVPVAAALEMEDLALEPFSEFLKNGCSIGGLLSLRLKVKGKANEALEVDLTSSMKNFSYDMKGRTFVKNMDVAIKEKGTLNLNEEKVTIESGELSLGDLSAKMKGVITGITSQPDLDVNITAKDLSLSGWNERFPAADALAGLTGTGNITWLVKGQVNSNIHVSGTTSLEHLTYRDTKTQQTLFQDMDIHIKHSLALDVKRDMLDIKDLRLTLQETPVTIEGTISQLKKNPNMNLNIAVQKTLLKKWVKTFPLLQEMMDLKGDMDVTVNLKGRLDKLVDIKFLLNSGRLEIDRVKKKEPGQKQSKVGGKVEVVRKRETEKKGDIFGRFDVEGKITIGQGRFEKIRFENFVANLTKKGRVFDLTDMAFDTFKGRVIGKGRVDMTRKTPRYSLATKVDRTDVHEIYNTFASPKDLLFGLLVADFTATGVGFEGEELTKNLNAKGRFKLRDGRLTSFNLLKEIASIANLLGVETHGEETRFSNLSMDFKIESGKILTDNLSLTMEHLNLTASGNIGLDKTIDLSANAWLSSGLGSKMPKFTQYIFERDEKGRLLVPFHLAGSLMKPRLRLNTQALKAQVKRGIKEEVEKGIEKIPVEKEIKGILKDILGR